MDGAERPVPAQRRDRRRDSRRLRPRDRYAFCLQKSYSFAIRIFKISFLPTKTYMPLDPSDLRL